MFEATLLLEVRLHPNTRSQESFCLLMLVVFCLRVLGLGHIALSNA
jgi:hypothetical protein